MAVLFCKGGLLFFCLGNYSENEEIYVRWVKICCYASESRCASEICCASVNSLREWNSATPSGWVGQAINLSLYLVHSVFFILKSRFRYASEIHLRWVKFSYAERNSLTRVGFSWREGNSLARVKFTEGEWDSAAQVWIRFASMNSGQAMNSRFIYGWKNFLFIC